MKVDNLAAIAIALGRLEPGRVLLGPLDGLIRYRPADFPKFYAEV